MDSALFQVSPFPIEGTIHLTGCDLLVAQVVADISGGEIIVDRQNVFGTSQLDVQFLNRCPSGKVCF